MENFIRVTAEPCNPEGLTGRGPHVPPQELLLNPNLVAAIRNNEVFLKDSNILHIGGNYFTNFRVAEKRQAKSF